MSSVPSWHLLEVPDLQLLVEDILPDTKFEMLLCIILCKFMFVISYLCYCIHGIFGGDFNWFQSPNFMYVNTNYNHTHYEY